MKTSRSTRLVAGALLALSIAAGATPAFAAGPKYTSMVFQATNDPAGNALQLFERQADGTLAVGDLVATGGLGSGDSLASQGAVVRDGRHVLVINAGDSTVSSLILDHGDLELADVAPSGGVRPVSVTMHDGVVYVLNAGSDSISGLRLDADGDLRPIPDSSRPLSGTGTGAAQVQFNGRGDALVVTEKATNNIDVFRVGTRGRASGPEVYPSSGGVPYGFDIDRRGNVIVSEAAAGAVSSYDLRKDSLDLTTPSLSDTQAAPCWLEISRDGRFAYTTNAASSTISSYRIGRDGSLTLLAAVAATTGAGPTDIAQSSDGASLFVRMRSGSVGAYAIGNDGSLTSLGEFAGAASVGTSGLAAS